MILTRALTQTTKIAKVLPRTVTQSSRAAFASVPHESEDEPPKQKNSFGGKFDWEDPLNFKSLLTDEEVRVFEHTNHHCHVSFQLEQIAHPMTNHNHMYYTLLYKRRPFKKRPTPSASKNFNLKSSWPIVTKLHSITMT